MKKFHVYALSAAAACAMLGTVSFPAYAALSYSVPGGKMIVIGQNGGTRSGEALSQTLNHVSGSGNAGCDASNFSGITLPDGLDFQFSSSGCIISGGINLGCQNSTGNDCTASGCQSNGSSGCTGFGCQETGTCNPGASGTQKPDTSNPGSSGTQKPDISNPGSSGTQKPDTSNPGSSSGVNQDSYAAQVVSLVNEERAKAGLAPLTVNNEAAAAAMTRAKETEISFSHTRPSGKSFSTALTEAGVSFRSAGENIAYGQTSAAQVMESWMNSAGHRANILNSSYTQIGVAHYKNASGTDYWVQLFLN